MESASLSRQVVRRLRDFVARPRGQGSARGHRWRRCLGLDSPRNVQERYCTEQAVKPDELYVDVSICSTRDDSTTAPELFDVEEDATSRETSVVELDPDDHQSCESPESRLPDAGVLLGSSVGSASSQSQWAEPSQTLIFLDWDDTLFPTYELFARWNLPMACDAWDSIQFSEEQQLALQKWRDALEQYLDTVCSLTDRCAIVTSSERPWVARCVERFAPSLKALFEQPGGPQVIYALEHLPEEDPTPRTVASRAERHALLTKAKFLAMHHEACTFYSRYPDQTWKNIISVGDAVYEHDAAQRVAQVRSYPQNERLRLKAFITPTKPQLNELIYHLKVGVIMWRAYVSFDGDIDLDMNAPDKWAAIADAVEMPELRSTIQHSLDGVLEDDVEESLEDMASFLSEILDEQPDEESS